MILEEFDDVPSGPAGERLAVGVRLLCVGTDPDLLATTASRLEERDDDFVVETVQSADAALERLATDREYHCVVSEYTLAETDGLGLMRSVRDREPDLPFILLVGESAGAVASEALAAGVTDVVDRSTAADSSAVVAHRVRNAVDRHRAERIARQTTKAVDVVDEAMAFFDDDGELVYANEAYGRLFGETPGAVVGTTFGTRFADPERARFETDIHPTVRQRGRWTGEARARTTDGREFPAEHVVYRFADGGYLHQAADISERETRARRLASFRHAIEHAGHAVMLTDTDGRIEYANPAFEEVSGYAREEVVGETPALLRSGAHDEAFYADLWETITDGEVWENEVVNRRKNGDPYHLEQTIAPIVADDGEIERSVAINTDISDLKNQERELKRQNERLERYGRTVAHDLRNPLNVLEARIEYLETNEVESLDEHCETMYQSIAKMKTLIDELLTLAKHGQTVLEPTALSLEEVAATAWSQSETRTATLLVSDSVLLMADETRLEELFGNLFRNVAEHVGPDATVRVGTLDDADGFYVADDGPGIPEDERENVLDLGYTTAEEGTGFGLAIVNEIAEAHGWSVRITESADGGTRFEISQVDGVESASPRDGDE